MKTIKMSVIGFSSLVILCVALPPPNYYLPPVTVTISQSSTSQSPPEKTVIPTSSTLSPDIMTPSIELAPPFQIDGAKEGLLMPQISSQLGESDDDSLGPFNRFDSSSKNLDCNNSSEIQGTSSELCVDKNSSTSSATPPPKTEIESPTQTPILPSKPNNQLFPSPLENNPLQPKDPPQPNKQRKTNTYGADGITNNENEPPSQPTNNDNEPSSIPKPTYKIPILWLLPFCSTANSVSNSHLTHLKNNGDFSQIPVMQPNQIASGSEVVTIPLIIPIFSSIVNKNVSAKPITAASLESRDSPEPEKNKEFNTNRPFLGDCCSLAKFPGLTTQVPSYPIVVALYINANHLSNIDIPMVAGTDSQNIFPPQITTKLKMDYGQPSTNNRSTAPLETPLPVIPASSQQSPIQPRQPIIPNLRLDSNSAIPTEKQIPQINNEIRSEVPALAMTLDTGNNNYQMPQLLLHKPTPAEITSKSQTENEQPNTNNQITTTPKTPLPMILGSSQQFPIQPRQPVIPNSRLDTNFALPTEKQIPQIDNETGHPDIPVLHMKLDTENNNYQIPQLLLHKPTPAEITSNSQTENEQPNTNNQLTTTPKTLLQMIFGSSQQSPIQPRQPVIPNSRLDTNFALPTEKQIPQIDKETGPDIPVLHMKLDTEYNNYEVLQVLLHKPSPAEITSKSQTENEQPNTNNQLKTTPKTPLPMILGSSQQSPIQPRQPIIPNLRLDTNSALPTEKQTSQIDNETSPEGPAFQMLPFTGYNYETPKTSLTLPTSPEFTTKLQTDNEQPNINNPSTTIPKAPLSSPVITSSSQQSPIQPSQPIIPNSRVDTNSTLPTEKQTSQIDNETSPGGPAFQMLPFTGYTYETPKTSLTLPTSPELTTKLQTDNAQPKINNPSTTLPEAPLTSPVITSSSQQSPIQPSQPIIPNSRLYSNSVFPTEKQTSQIDSETGTELSGLHNMTSDSGNNNYQTLQVLLNKPTHPDITTKSQTDNEQPNINNSLTTTPKAPLPVILESSQSPIQPRQPIVPNSRLDSNFTFPTEKQTSQIDNETDTELQPNQSERTNSNMYLDSDEQSLQTSNTLMKQNSIITGNAVSIPRKENLDTSIGNVRTPLEKQDKPPGFTYENAHLANPHVSGTPFNIDYTVKDDTNSTGYSHNAISDGDVINGKYQVQLPDGRTQIVKYTADWATGFHANVTYEGMAKYPNTSSNYKTTLKPQ